MDMQAQKVISAPELSRKVWGHIFEKAEGSGIGRAQRDRPRFNSGKYMGHPASETHITAGIFTKTSWSKLCYNLCIH